MRIAIVATSYPSSPGDASGHFVRAEALALARDGHEVHVVAPSPVSGDLGVTAHAAGGARLFQWPGAAARSRERPSRLLSAVPFLHRAARALSGIHPDKVIAHWMVPSAWPISFLASPPELEVVCHGADVRLLLAMPRPLREHIVRRVVARSSRIRLVASSLLEALASSLPRETARDLSRIAVVRPPLVEVSSAVLRPPGGARYAVCAARLIADKRIELSVDAVLLSKHDLALVVIGDGPMRESLGHGASPRVRFLGRLGREETLGWVRGAVALLHTSSVDAAPTTVLEARALDVPVVSCGAGDVALWAKTDPGISLASPTARAVASALDLIAQR